MSSDTELHAPRGRTIVIGLGNEDRGDDGAGPVTVRRLRSRLPDGVEVVPDPGDAAGLLDLWEGAGCVYLVDATRAGRPPGSIVRWEAGADGPLPPTRAASTHGLSLAEAIGLGEALGRRPDRLVVYGIEPSTFAPGPTCSPEVERASAEVAERILAELRTPGPIAPGRRGSDA